jgi:hypothetical protein
MATKTISAKMRHLGVEDGKSLFGRTEDFGLLRFFLRCFFAIPGLQLGMAPQIGLNLLSSVQSAS